ncbi:MFS transporter [Weissella confusa]|uniref:MFS transporter n=1 Tax=Weissella confusa TaxID=1583 RepID=UPI0021A578D8|nr:MFS transporter [Weissella confusa]MCT2910623.1 MFS transporter [Weissella confusa]
MNKHSFWFKVALLSIATLTNAAAAVQVTVPLIHQTLGGHSQTDIELLMSVSSLGILIFVLLSPLVTRLIGNKRTVVLGLLVSVIAGVTPMFTENYTIILASRFLFGAGVGLFNSLSFSLISMYYTGHERDALIGYRDAAAAMVTTLLTWVVGFLMGGGWHAAFGVYALGAIPLVLFGLLVPDNTPVVEEEHVTASGHVRVNGAMIFSAVFAFFWFTAYFGITVKMAPVFAERGYGTAADASFVTGLVTAFQFLSSLLFGQIKRLLGRYSIAIGATLAMAMVFILIQSQSLIVSAVAVAGYGFAFGMVMPGIFSNLAAETNAVSQTLGLTMMLVGINVGVSASPYVLKALNGWFNQTSEIANYVIISFMLLLLAIVAFMKAAIRYERHTDKLGETAREGKG